MDFEACYLKMAAKKNQFLLPPLGEGRDEGSADLIGWEILL